MIQTVVFDLGKVLVDFDYTIAARKIVAAAQITLEDFGRFISHSPLFMQYETGLVTSEEFHREICRITGLRNTLGEFALSFGDIFSPIEPMVQLHAELRRRGFPTYIFSNTNELAVRHIRGAFPFFSEFDGHILSFEHRSMKPDAKLYEVVERMSGRRGAEILYLDDRPENIEAGAARGWQVILQENPDKTRAAIQQLGLLNHAASKS